jgi:hypothetical protein
LEAALIKLFLGLSLTIFVVFLISCREKTEKNTFSEVKGFDTPVQGQEIKMPVSPHTGGVPEVSMTAQQLDWILPKGWTAKEGTGMYYAVFKTSDKSDADEGGIIVLPGEAGGLHANIERWAGQLGLSLPNNVWVGFVSSQKKLKSKGNLEVTLVDFSPMVAKGGKSMLVGIVKPGEDSYFLKLTGSRESMVKTKADFLKFCESLVLK